MGKARWTVVSAGIAAVLGAIAIVTGEVPGVVASRSARGGVDGEAWRAHLASVDRAIDEDDVSQAMRAWAEAYGASLGGPASPARAPAGRARTPARADGGPVTPPPDAAIAMAPSPKNRPWSGLGVDPRRAITDTTIVCLICGKAFRQLTNTHLRTHAVTTTDYKRRFGYNAGRALMAQALRR